MKSSANRQRNGQNQVALREVARSGLAVLDEATRMLAETDTLDDVKAIRDKAETARIHARAVNAGLELQNNFAELKLLAERKAGEFLRSLTLRGGDRRSKGHDVPLKLADLGISRAQSKRWQKEASVPEDDFCRFLADTRENGVEITASGLIRMAARHAKNGKPPTRRSAHRNGGPHVGDLDGESPLVARRELIDEVRHHQRALAEVLEPFIEGAGESPENDRRMVRYLLGELARVIEELAATAE